MTASLPTLVQSVTAASSATGGTSQATGTLGTASTKGNTLLAVVAVVATSGPTITDPGAPWTLISKVPIGNLNVASYANFNNAGGITSLTFTIGGTSVQGSVAGMAEFSGMGTAAALEVSVSQSNAGSSSWGFVPISGTIPNYNELLFAVLGFDAATINGNSNDASVWSAAFMTAVSTVGVPNAQIACFWGVNKNQFQPAYGGTFSTAPPWATTISRFTSTASSPVGGFGAGGGQFESTGGNPAGSLQVPQPQGSGNFYSGTTGSF